MFRYLLCRDTLSDSIFPTLWMGSHCKKCGRQEFCGDRIK